MRERRSVISNSASHALMMFPSGFPLPALSKSTETAASSDSDSASPAFVCACGAPATHGPWGHYNATRFLVAREPCDRRPAS